MGLIRAKSVEAWQIHTQLFPHIAVRTMRQGFCSCLTGDSAQEDGLPYPAEPVLNKWASQCQMTSFDAV